MVVFAPIEIEKYIRATRELDQCYRQENLKHLYDDKLALSDFVAEDY